MLEITCKGTPYEVCFDISTLFIFLIETINTDYKTKTDRIPTWVSSKIPNRRQYILLHLPLPTKCQNLLAGSSENST